MSHCRFAWDGSDVYVYDHVEGFIHCCGCHLAAERDFQASTPEEMIAHLIEHKKAGDFVPTYAITSLWTDVDGPNEPVRPEPETMTQARQMVRDATLRLALDRANTAERQRADENGNSEERLT